MIYLIIFAILLFLTLSSWFIMLNTRRKITGPFPFPIAGNALRFIGSNKDFFKAIDRLVKDYADIILVHILTKRYVMVIDPVHVEAIVSSTEYITKGISYYYLQPWLGLGLLTSSGQRWKTHRKFLTPAFHFNISQNFLPVFCKNAAILNNKLEMLTKKQPTVDVFPLIALAALDNVTESIMGVSVNAQKDSESAYVKAIEDLSNLISTRMRNPFVGEDIVFNLLPLKNRQNKALKILHGQTMNVIEARKKELKKLNIISLPQQNNFGIKNKHAFLDLLLLSEIDGKKIDDEKVREEVDTFMFEGHDTTTSGVAFALYCISRHPEVQQKIYEEQKNIFGDDLLRDPINSELADMKYLEMVIKESLRLYPSVPLIERLLLKDSDVAGIKLPKNTSVIVNIFHMQRRPDLYENPLEFKPERFDVTDNRNPFGWIPFSAGPRNCIGQKFAMMELKVTISAIVRKFKLLPTNYEPELVADLILRSRNGVHVQFELRN